jgi:hypothetical protein
MTISEVDKEIFSMKKHSSKSKTATPEYQRFEAAARRIFSVSAKEIKEQSQAPGEHEDFSNLQKPSKCDN